MFDMPDMAEDLFQQEMDGLLPRVGDMQASPGGLAASGAREGTAGAQDDAPDGGLPEQERHSERAQAETSEVRGVCDAAFK